MMNYEEDTIVAISSAHGRGAIGVVRLSGQKSLEIASELFTDLKGKGLKSFERRTIYHGHLKDGREYIDDVLMFAMEKPHSYTGENLVEISCHGNPIILEKIISACVHRGARIAQPGEFTKRAFLNGKMDLTQAEAVAELIEAKSEKAVSLAVANISGKLRSRIDDLRAGLLDILADIEARLDFSEEDIKHNSSNIVYDRIYKYIHECLCLIQSFEYGKVIRDGLKVVIVGKANAGKSCLFNRLLNADRAIVNQQAGTTRDVIEESMLINEVPIALVDTAGISVRCENDIDIESIRRSKEAIGFADILLFVIDRSCRWSDQDEEIVKLAKGKSGVAIINKSDLPRRMNIDKIGGEIASWPFVEVSSLYCTGIEDVKHALFNIYVSKFVCAEAENGSTCNMRQSVCLMECKDSLQQAVEAMSDGYHEEVVAMEVRRAVDRLAGISGENISDEVLNRIFSKFCVGK